MWSPPLAPFALQLLGGRVPASCGKRAQFGCEIVERQLRLAAQGLAKDLAHLRFGRVSVPRRPALQPGHQILVDITDAEARHIAPVPSMLTTIANWMSVDNENCRKILPPYSMTSSARARISGGMVMPSALAVLRLTTRVNRVGCSTGRSAGLAPFRILST